MKRINRKVVLKSVITFCLMFMAFIGITCGATYAVTDGETANPITAIKFFINGEDVSETISADESGNYTVNLNNGDNFTMENGNTEVFIQTYASKDEEDKNVSLKINSQTSEVDVEIGKKAEE